MVLPLVYLHGLFGGPADFHEMIQVLGGHAVSLPGHSLSTRRESKLLSSSHVHQIDVFHDLLEKLKRFTPCVLVGYSMGGRIALKLQKSYPELFPKIICLASHLGIQSDEERIKRREWEDHWIENFRTLPNEKVFEMWYSQPLFRSFRAHLQFRDIIKQRLSLDLFEIAKVFDQTRRSLLPGFIPSITQALFLTGEDDDSVLKHYQEYLPADQYFVIEKSGHCLHIENPIICSKVIQSWLEGTHDLHRRKNERRMEVSPRI